MLTCERREAGSAVHDSCYGVPPGHQICAGLTLQLEQDLRTVLTRMHAQPLQSLLHLHHTSVRHLRCSWTAITRVRPDAAHSSMNTMILHPDSRSRTLTASGGPHACRLRRMCDTSKRNSLRVCLLDWKCVLWTMLTVMLGMAWSAHTDQAKPTMWGLPRDACLPGTCPASSSAWLVLTQQPQGLPLTPLQVWQWLQSVVCRSAARSLLGLRPL